MKYHKIRNVSADICTREQLIAYRLCAYYGAEYRKTWRESAKAHTATARSEFKADCIRDLMKRYPQAINYCNRDLVFCILNAGLENWFNSDVMLLNSYEEIGGVFPNYYKTVTSCK